MIELIAWEFSFPSTEGSCRQIRVSVPVDSQDVAIPATTDTLRWIDHVLSFIFSFLNFLETLPNSR